jgi:serine/threonine protein kinase
MQKALAVGTILRNQYLVQELLSKGAFSAVYLVNSVSLVEDPRGKRYSSTRFALKEVVIPSRHLRHHVHLETIALRGIDHEGLPHIYEVFNINRYNRLYILMDYIEGPNLEKVSLQHSGGQLPLPQVMTIVPPLLDAVSYLHSQQPPIIHQNIEPASIILSRADNKPVLVDFGVGKQYNLSSRDVPVRDPMIGYEAPEQYDGEISTRSDIYGLGATLYTLLTGVVPADAHHRKRLIESENVDPLKSVDQLVPAIPTHVAEAIQQAMSLNSDERFPTVGQFHQALKADPAGHPTQKLHLRRVLELDQGNSSCQLSSRCNAALSIEDQRVLVPDVSPLLPIDQQVTLADVEFSIPSQPHVDTLEPESPLSLAGLPLPEVEAVLPDVLDQQLPEAEGALSDTLDQQALEPVHASLALGDQQLSVGVFNGMARLTAGSLSSRHLRHDEYSHRWPDVDIEMSFSQAGCEWFVKTQEQQNNKLKNAP